MKRSAQSDELDDRDIAELQTTERLLPQMFSISAKLGEPHGPGIVVGELIAITEHGTTPLVLYAGQSGTAAVPARSIVDLDGTQIGKQVLLLFENTKNADPIVVGVLREPKGARLPENAAAVDVQADGERLLISARKRLVLRCGKASITLTEEGKILIQGRYLSSRASGVHRIKGGSVQIN
jgi:hypothetical protein